MFRGVQFSRCTASWNGITIRGIVICVKCSQGRHCITGSVVMEWSWNTRDEYCEMILTPGTCNSRASTAAREYMLRYPARHHTDEECVLMTGAAPPRDRKCNTATSVSSDRPRTVRMPANEDPIIAAVEREPWRSIHYITQKMGPSEPRDFEVLHDD
jgi:hypothetical protein